MEKTVENEFKKISEHFTKKYDSIVSVIAYGSRTFSKATSDSHYDCWFIVSNYDKFYRNNLKDRRTFFTTIFWPFEEHKSHIFLNKLNPNFYQEQLNGNKVKYGVVSLDDFVKYCDKNIFRMYVSGRFQKPIEVIYCNNRKTKETICNAVEQARKEGLEKATTLENLTFDELEHKESFRKVIKRIVKMGYDADIRPESPNKVQDIIDGSGEELEKIYSKLLPYISLDKDINLIKRNIFLNRFFSGLMNLKNGLTNRFAFSYLIRKIKRRYEKN